MAKINTIEDLKVWQEARALNQLVYRFIYSNKELKDFDLKNQINSASGSIMDNIAEGFGRGGNKEFRQFLTIARGSTTEVKSQVLRSSDRAYIKAEQTDLLLNQISTISKMINGLISSLNKTDLKGSKYKVEEEEVEYLILNQEH
ncbi:four helix bundle protein [Roseivirga pacifica]|uniref:four helix bundle protein n=1 Tax=Roseivirga pacifica TaxID=1267423 RepID=UPI003BAE4D94